MGTMKDELLDRMMKIMGISKLYPPQTKALPHVMEGKNVVISAPTAGGKSFVAYYGAVKNVLHGRKSLFIVPLRAIAHEKYEELNMFRELGLRVGISTGELGDSGGRLGRYDIIVVTSEKADSIFRHSPSWINDIGFVAVDEVHLLNDASRGPTLEVIMAKLLHMADVQVVALSATIKNVLEISEWIGAEPVISSWRPVPLKQGVLFGKAIYYDNGEVEPIDKAGISGVIENSLMKGQVLVFVNSRKNAQSSAFNFASITEKFLEEDEREELKEMAERLVQEDNNMITRKLASCIRHGVAFHHAGMSSIARREVEKKFKEGTIKLIAATPTLAAGINLPARRVIIKSVWRYSSLDGYMVTLPVMEIKQMMGRAGRPGYDEVGEAILIARNEMDKDRLMEEYIYSEPEPVYSKLASEAALRMHILALISTEFATTWEEVIKFMKKTFYAHQLGMVPEDKIWDILDFLERNEFIESMGEKWKATLFGRITTNLYLDPLSSIRLKEALLNASPETPPFAYLHAISSTPDMRGLYVSSKDDWIDEKILQSEFIVSVPEPYSLDYDWFLQEVKTASMLEDWINEMKEDDIIVKYGIGPGDIRNRVEVAEWLLHSMRELARLFNFELVPVIGKLMLRVKYGCKEELLNLTQLHGVGRVRARALYSHGYKSISLLRKASMEQLASIPGIGDKTARKIKEQVGNG